MSKEQALSDYLKKIADPTYTSKVIGGGIIFKKAQSKDSWKKRIYYIKDDKKLLYFYYGGKAKPPLGMLDVTSALLSMGPADNIKKSGAIKTEAVSISASLANETADNNNKHFVFETTSEAKKFALMLCYISKNNNVMVFAQMMDWQDLEDACAVIAGNSRRKFLDVSKCNEKAPLEAELAKYDDELEDNEHQLQLFTNIKAQNSKTKTNDETFEVLQANLLLPIVEQRAESLKKKKQEVYEKFLEVRSFLAGQEKAKLEEKKSTPAPPPPPPRSTSSVTSSACSSPSDSIEENEVDKNQEQASPSGEAGSKTLRLKSFRRLLSMSRSKSVVSDEGNAPSAEQTEKNNESSAPPLLSAKRLTASTTPRKSTSQGLSSTPQTASGKGSQVDNSSKREMLFSPLRNTPESHTARNESFPHSTLDIDRDSSSQNISHRGSEALPNYPVENSYMAALNNSTTNSAPVIVDDETHVFCSECLRTMKSFIPFDMSSCDYTESILVKKQGLTPKLAERILKKKILWIIHLTIREIGKISDRDISTGGKYNIKGHNLDLVELASVYAVLPERFTSLEDPSGHKELWRRDIEERLAIYIRGKKDGTLTSDELRHEAYTSANMGEKWQQQASLDAKLHHMASLLSVIKVDCEDGASNESTENSFEKLSDIQQQLTSLMAAKQYKKIVAAKKAASQLKRKMASRREEV